MVVWVRKSMNFAFYSSGRILKVKLTSFANRFDTGCEGGRSDTDGSKVFVLTEEWGLRLLNEGD